MNSPQERLEERMRAELERHRADIDNELRDLTKRMGAIERWQSWVFGAFAGLAMIAGVFGRGVLKRLGFVV